MGGRFESLPICRIPFHTRMQPDPVSILSIFIQYHIHCSIKPCPGTDCEILSEILQYLILKIL